MKTIIYFVRHAESPYAAGIERTRGLSEQGSKDAEQVRDLLRTREIHAMISSPYERAIQTIQPLAEELQHEMILVEGLKERTLGNIGEESFQEAKRKLYTDFQFKYEFGESSREAQTRAIRELKRLLKEYAGKTIVIGTHGDIMTLMMNYFDNRYSIAFWESTSMPDIYELQFSNDTLEHVQRIWK